MHYIVGTRFGIAQQKVQLGRPGVPLVRKEKILPAGLFYQLIHISKKDTQFEYHFLASDGNKYVATFNSCRDADIFIAKHLNEVLPNYNPQPEVEGY